MEHNCSLCPKREMFKSVFHLYISYNYNPEKNVNSKLAFSSPFALFNFLRISIPFSPRVFKFQRGPNPFKRLKSHDTSSVWLNQSQPVSIDTQLQKRWVLLKASTEATWITAPEVSTEAVNINDSYHPLQDFSLLLLSSKEKKSCSEQKGGSQDFSFSFLLYQCFKKRSTGSRFVPKKQFSQRNG